MINVFSVLIYMLRKRNVKKAQCQESLEYQTRGLVALQGQLDAGETDEDLLITRKRQAQGIKSSRINYKTRIDALENIVRAHQDRCREDKEELDSMREIWAKTGVESL